MGYYIILLTDAANKVCTITTIFGKYEYSCLPTGVCIIPEKFQGEMSALMYGLEFVRVYLKILLVITSGSFDKHLSKVKEVVKRLQLAGLKCNIDRCKFASPKLEYLGYTITRESIKPDPEKLKQLSILNALRIKNRWGSS